MVKKKTAKTDSSNNPESVLTNVGGPTEEVIGGSPNIRRSSRARRVTATILTSDLSLPSFNSPSICRDSVSTIEKSIPLPKKRRISESAVKKAKTKSTGNNSVTADESIIVSVSNEKKTEGDKTDSLESPTSEETVKTNDLENSSLLSETGRGKRMKKPKKFADEEIVETSSRRKSISKPKQSVKTDQSINDDKSSVTVENNVDKHVKMDAIKTKSLDLSGEEDVKANSAKRKSTKSKNKSNEDDERELSMVETADYNLISLSSKVGTLSFSNGFSISDRLNSVKQMKIQRENEKRLEQLRKEQEKKERAEKRRQELQKKRQEQKLLSLQSQNTYFPGFNIFMPTSMDISHDNTPDPDYTMDELFVTNSGRVVKNRNNYLRNRYDQCLFVDDKNPDITYDPNYEEECKRPKKETKQKLYEQSTVSRKFFGRGISSFFALNDDENETTSQEETDDEEEVNEKPNTVVSEVVKSTSTPTEDGFVINIDGEQKKRRIKFVVNRYKLHLINNKELRESMKVEVRLKLREKRLPFESKFKAIELTDRNYPGNYNVGILLANSENINNDENDDYDICVDDDLEDPIYHKTTYDAFVKEFPGKQVVDDIRQIETNDSTENIKLESIVNEIDKNELKYIVEKGLEIIKQQFYSERTYLNVDNSASVFHVFSRRNADLLFYYMSPYSRRSRELAHRAHLWFLQYLPDNLLAAYLNILRFAKSYGYKVSDILKENHDSNFSSNSNQKSEEIKRCIKDFINVKAVDPWYKEAKDALPASISNVTCFIVLPNISTYDYCPVNVMYKELMENFIPSIGSHTEFVNLCFKTPEPVSVAELMEHCIDKVKMQLQALLTSRPNDHIITIGWGVTNAIIHRVLSEIGGVSASINFAYCNKTSDGIIGDVDHELTLSYCPQLYIVGENSTMFDLKYFNITRQTMTCETGLVVIGNGDSNLRVSANTLIRERVTQSSVNLIITEVVKDFIEAVTPFDDIPIKEFRKIMQPTDMDLHLEVDCQLLKENHTILYSAQALKKANESKTFKGNMKIDITRPESPLTPSVKSAPITHQPTIIHKTISTPKSQTITALPTANDPIFTSDNSFKETSTFEESKNEGETSINNVSAIDLGDLDIGGFGSFF